MDSNAAEASSGVDLTRQGNADPFGLDALFSGGGEAGALMRGIDWAKTSLGPAEAWPQNLKVCVRIVLTSRQPMFVWWGDDLINLYNDAYKTIVGGKHPGALGKPARVVWREIWPQISPRVERAMRANEGTYDEALLLIMERYGYREETYYTFSYSPVPNDQGGTGGIFCANSDDTQRIISERQLSLLGDLAARTADARSWEEACRLTTASLDTDLKDLCFSMIYVLNGGKKVASLAGASGIEPGHPAAPESIAVGANSIWPVAEARTDHEIRVVEVADDRFELPTGAWDQSPRAVAILPIPASGLSGRSGSLVVGLNPYRALDENYSNFLRLIASQISASMANADAYEQERSRAESLTELDRAKTIFFSNVSHEFRTPLTLMLGPLEDLMAAGLGDAGQLRQIEVIHRNGLRLLKLVNTLLDFSRIEAGRVQAIYRPVDLCVAAVELASVFRAAIEAAGLQFNVDCGSLSRPVYVDAEMWEKIVLNLLSNALKFTMSGSISVTLREDPQYAELSVRDTGAGIPEAELSRVFERFHRIEGTPGRTHEGTGIGLALVEELVRLHGGTVSAASKQGSGTTFTVRLPFGKDHLPQNRVVDGAPVVMSSASSAALPYVQEALQWIPSLASESSFLLDSANQDLTGLFEAPGTRAGKLARVFVVDDNRDIREYMQRLLSRNYEVTSFEDGEEALAAILEDPPELVLTDVMMPRLDGFGLLRHLRADPMTAAIPVIMLSARAGEEARSEGMEAGADDYLVKPFTARELMARVGAHIAMYRLRSELTDREHQQRIKAEAAEGQYRDILESISEGFMFVDHDWTIRYMNHQSAAISGHKVEQSVGRSLWKEFPELEKSPFGEALRKGRQTGEIQHVEDFYPRLERWFHVNMYPSADGISIFTQDVSEKRRQQQQLLLTEKLAATGRLAATIAHEINNPLESVLNLLYLSRISRSATREKINEYLLTAEQELTRVSQIARHTLGFYRDSSVPSEVDIPRVLEDVLTVYASRLSASNIQVVKQFQPVSTLHALRGELHQVFSNLVSNAIDAMRGGGRLLLSLAPTQREQESGISIVIEDNGSGIARENRDRLFEPFFTTKVSVGTGLGLWVVKQFIEDHGGVITLDSSTGEENHGARFMIFLPLSSQIATKRRVTR